MDFYYHPILGLQYKGPKTFDELLNDHLAMMAFYKRKAIEFIGIPAEMLN